MKTDYLALIGWIWEEFEEVRRSAQRALELCHKALRTGDDGFWDGVALNLHSFYTGIETSIGDFDMWCATFMPLA